MKERRREREMETGSLRKKKKTRERNGFVSCVTVKVVMW